MTEYDNLAISTLEAKSDVEDLLTEIADNMKDEKSSVTNEFLEILTTNTTWVEVLNGHKDSEGLKAWFAAQKAQNNANEEKSRKERKLKKKTKEKRKTGSFISQPVSIAKPEVRDSNAKIASITAVYALMTREGTMTKSIGDCLSKLSESDITIGDLQKIISTFSQFNSSVPIGKLDIDEANRDYYKVMTMAALKKAVNQKEEKLFRYMDIETIVPQLIASYPSKCKLVATPTASLLMVGKSNLYSYFYDSIAATSQQIDPTKYPLDGLSTSVYDSASKELSLELGQSIKIRTMPEGIRRTIHCALMSVTIRQVGDRIATKVLPSTVITKAGKFVNDLIIKITNLNGHTLTKKQMFDNSVVYFVYRMIDGIGDLNKDTSCPKYIRKRYVPPNQKTLSTLISQNSIKTNLDKIDESKKKRNGAMRVIPELDYRYDVGMLKSNYRKALCLSKMFADVPYYKCAVGAPHAEHMVEAKGSDGGFTYVDINKARNLPGLTYANELKHIVKDLPNNYLVIHLPLMSPEQLTALCANFLNGLPIKSYRVIASEQSHSPWYYLMTSKDPEKAGTSYGLVDWVVLDSIGSLNATLNITLTLLASKADHFDTEYNNKLVSGCWVKDAVLSGVEFNCEDIKTATSTLTASSLDILSKTSVSFDVAKGESEKRKYTDEDRTKYVTAWKILASKRPSEEKKYYKSLVLKDWSADEFARIARAFDDDSSSLFETLATMDIIKRTTPEIKEKKKKLKNNNNSDTNDNNNNEFKTPPSVVKTKKSKANNSNKSKSRNRDALMNEGDDGKRNANEAGLTTVGQSDNKKVKVVESTQK